MSGLPVTISVIGGSGVLLQPLVSFFRAFVPLSPQKKIPPRLACKVVHVSGFYVWQIPNMRLRLFLGCADGLCADLCLQYLPATAPERTRCRQAVTRPNFSIGGTQFSHIRRRNSQMGR